MSNEKYSHWTFDVHAEGLRLRDLTRWHERFVWEHKKASNQASDYINELCCMVDVSFEMFAELWPKYREAFDNVTYSEQKIIEIQSQLLELKQTELHDRISISLSTLRHDRMFEWKADRDNVLSIIIGLRQDARKFVNHWGMRTYEAKNLGERATYRAKFQAALTKRDQVESMLQDVSAFAARITDW